MKQALNVSSNTLNRYFKAAVAIRPSNYLKIVELYKRVYNVEVEVLQSNVLQQDEEQNRAYRVTQLVNQLKQLTGCTEVLLKY
jgi:hypothetical protein